MNLRFSEQELRFRVSKSELELLCAGNDIEQCTYLSNDKSLKYLIKNDTNYKDMFLSYDNDYMILYVNNEYIRAFYESLPSRDGLEITQTIDQNKSINLVLEVDIRTQKRKRG